ncbi:hypothetical protein [Paenibacillus alvei]|uniref:hypothetical protein n=1 Tax=Paenibacillus alvei TaxID=44250 RepID=UPI0022819B27|nr:hypothetical protein [Paenibacillus alvei]
MTIIVIAIYLHKYYTWYMSIIFLFSDKKTGRKTCVQVFSNDIIIPILKKEGENRGSTIDYIIRHLPRKVEVMWREVGRNGASYIGAR